MEKQAKIKIKRGGKQLRQKNLNKKIVEKWQKIEKKDKNLKINWEKFLEKRENYGEKY